MPQYLHIGGCEHGNMVEVSESADVSLMPSPVAGEPDGGVVHRYFRVFTTVNVDVFLWEVGLISCPRCSHSARSDF